MVTVDEVFKKSRQLQEEAYKLGCTRSSLVWADDVVFDPRVLLKCRQNLCTHYGKNFMCPPYAPSSQDFRQGAVRFKLALLIQQEIEADLELTGQEGEREFKKVSLAIHRTLLTLEKRAFNLGFVFSLALGGGHCRLCETCGAKRKEEACPRPEEARSSMEAVGIDVFATCEKAGFPAAFQKGIIRATGLLFIT